MTVAQLSSIKSLPVSRMEAADVDTCAGWMEFLKKKKQTARGPFSLGCFTCRLVPLGLWESDFILPVLVDA
jgi:hypothetical protein